eukprot:gene18184-21161_t
MVNFIQASSPNTPAENQASACVSRLAALTLEKIINEDLHRQVNKVSRCMKGPSTICSDQVVSSQSSMMLNDPLVKFQSSYEPDVSIEYYIQRIFKHSKCSDSCLTIMLVYIDRLIENHGLVLTKLNAHRMIITSLMVAAKYHDDLFYNNAYFAKLGGIPLPELNMLEVEFLKLLDFSMFVHANLFEKYQSQLQSYQMYLQLQYSPSSTAVRPIGSPYSHQCENAFHFSPHRYVHDHQPSNTGYFV